VKSLSLRYLAERLPDAVKQGADEIGLVAVGILLTLAIWRSLALTRTVTADERVSMRAAAWSILQDPEGVGRQEPPTRE
jgi:hypothetical protein